jgi:hypothetical protein
MSDGASSKPTSFADYGYTAFETWEYRPLIYVLEANMD